MTRIAIDAMGGDYAPHEIIAGSVWAAYEYNVPIELVGKHDDIIHELEKIKQNGFISDCGKKGTRKRIHIDISKLDIKITHADEIIEMGEHPGQAIRKKKKSSIVIGVKSVVDGSSDALVAAGSTGAAMAASLFGMGRISGIIRPAIAATIPSLKKPIVVIDGGANSECTPEMLYQFAIMGCLYSKQLLGIKNPRVGVLNIGSEETKGNTLAQETYKLLEKNKDKFNFIGNVEGNKLLLDTCDVAVSDGFVGNVTLKVTEGVATLLFRLIKEQFKSSVFGSMVGLMAQMFFKKIYPRINYEEYGGSLLLGVKGITVISHGRSKAYAIKNAVRVAKEAVETGLNKKITEMLGE
ncbi:phosphate acyltransferase PlsX [bacterium]|nr:phosphate acyltransferase PlsX [bacterium]